MRCMALCVGKGTTKTPGGGIVKEFNCKGHIYTVQVRKGKRNGLHLSPEKEIETSQLDHIIGPRRRDYELYLCNDVRTWATWDHYSHICQDTG